MTVSSRTDGTAIADPSVPHSTPEEKKRRVFTIMAASSGNLVEWFDFYVYAFSAIYFAAAFFPRATPRCSY